MVLHRSIRQGNVYVVSEFSQPALAVRWALPGVEYGVLEMVMGVNPNTYLAVHVVGSQVLRRTFTGALEFKGVLEFLNVLELNTSSPEYKHYDEIKQEIEYVGDIWQATTQSYGIHRATYVFDPLHYNELSKRMHAIKDLDQMEAVKITEPGACMYVEGVGALEGVGDCPRSLLVAKDEDGVNFSCSLYDLSSIQPMTTWPVFPASMTRDLILPVLDGEALYYLAISYDGWKGGFHINKDAASLRKALLFVELAISFLDDIEFWASSLTGGREPSVVNQARSDFSSSVYAKLLNIV